MLINNIDTTLDVISKIAWILFFIFGVIFFIRTLYYDGLTTAAIRMFSFKVLLPLLLVVFISILSYALVFIEPQTAGVVITAIGEGGVRPQPLRGGLKWIVPILEEVQIYPIQWQTYTMSGKPAEGQKAGDDSIRARTKDGQEVILDSSVIFRIDVNQVVRIHIDWQDRYIEDLIRPLMRGLLRTEVSQYTVDEVNSSDRKDLEASLDRILRTELLEKGLILDRFILRDITFSDEYAASVEEKQVALEREIQAVREAQRLRELASGQADALTLIGEALERNQDILTYRYIDKLSPNIRVMLVPNNNPLILPLPNLDMDTTNALSPTATLTDTVGLGTFLDNLGPMSPQ